MLSLIIPGPRSITGKHFDIFLEPLLQELLQLWVEGINTIDAARFNEMRTFKLRAILLWTIHDFPAYGIVSGCVTKEYKGCPVCGPNTISRRSITLRKCVHDNQHQKWLPEGHPFRSMTESFNGMVENSAPPQRLTATQVIHFRLPYWHVCANSGAVILLCPFLSELYFLCVRSSECTPQWYW
jgi:hypothetical protein